MKYFISLIAIFSLSFASCDKIPGLKKKGTPVAAVALSSNELQVGGANVVFFEREGRRFALARDRFSDGLSLIELNDEKRPYDFGK